MAQKISIILMHKMRDTQVLNLVAISPNLGTKLEILGSGLVWVLTISRGRYVQNQG